MSTVERLLKATEEIWAGEQEQPVVVGLGAGTLDGSKFSRGRIEGCWELLARKSLP